MDLKDIKELINMMRKNDLSVFKLEQEGFKITLKRGADFQPIVTQTTLPPALMAQAVASAPAADAAGTPAAAEKEILREILSPMVGTFYAAPKPDAPPYMSPGQSVAEEAVVCIIEAMKVMNEIKSEIRGTIVEVVAESGKPVQYGQVLFRVR